MTFKFEFLNFSLVILIFKASIVARVNCQIENVAIKTKRESLCIQLKLIVFEEYYMKKKSY